MAGRRFKALRIGELVADLPIVQGGMGVGISLSGLASATANAGGIGVIAAAGIGLLEADGFTDFLGANVRALRREIRRAKELSKGIIGVNVMVALRNFADLVRTAVEEKVDIIFSGAGLPMNLPELVAGSRTKIAPIVSSARAAALIARRWLDKYGRLPDAFVVEGPKAGGHLGYKVEELEDPAFALEATVPAVVETARLLEEEHGRPIPVIPGGGIYTGSDIARFLDMGASGVQMATRFVATDECDASPAFKEAFVRAKTEDLAIIKSPVGMPGRAIRNEFIGEVEKGGKKPFSCPYHCIHTCDHTKAPYCISLALMNAQRGRLDHGFAFAGANVGRVEGIVPVKTLTDSLRAEYEATGQTGA